LLFDDHLGNLHVAHGGSSNVDETTSPLTERCMSVTSSGRRRSEHDQIAFGMVGRDRVRDVLHQHGLAGGGGATINARWPLPIGATMSITLQKGPSGGVFRLEPEALVGNSGVRLSKLTLCLDFSGIFEIERIDFEQRKIAFAFLGAADMASMVSPVRSPKRRICEGET
jgi:hypothetical protein